MQKSNENILLDGIIAIPRLDAILLMEAGYLYLKMGQFQKSKEVFEGLMNLLPHSDIPCVGLSRVYFAQNKLKKSRETLELALKRNPKSALALAHLGEIEFYEKAPEKALKTLEKSLALDPKGTAGQLAKELIKGYEQGLFSFQSP